MSDQSTNLQLPFLASGQAQKHVTVNESLLKLDALVQLSIKSATTAAQPASPADGDVYVLPSGKSGAAWAGMSVGALAYYRDGAWAQITPREGWRGFVRDTDHAVFYTGVAWAPLTAALRVSATDRVLGRSASGAGPAEELTFTDQAQALCDDTSFAAMRATLDAVGVSDAQTISGAKTFSTTLTIASNDPDLYLSETDGPSNAKHYRAVIDGGTYYFQALNDAKTAANAIFTVTRSGATPTGLSVGCPLLPIADATQNLGDASHRFGTVYAATGAINTSDAREKTPLEPLPDSVTRAARRILNEVGSFQWLSSIAQKGETGARRHIGVTAQSVRDAFVAEGEDPNLWALFCADQMPGEADRLSIRTDQLLWLIHAATLQRP